MNSPTASYGVSKRTMGGGTLLHIRIFGPSDRRSPRALHFAPRNEQPRSKLRGIDGFHGGTHFPFKDFAVRPHYKNGRPAKSSKGRGRPSKGTDCIEASFKVSPPAGDEGNG